MNTNTTYLETYSHDPRYNLAFEEYVLRHRTDGPYLLLWQNDKTVVVGQNQYTEAEIDRAFVDAHEIAVVRRSTGGGAVYHDLGNLNYSFIVDAGDAEQLTMDQFTRPVVKALRALGLSAEASGRNDILISGKKVSGTAQRLLNGRILHHGTLLFDTNSNMAAGALRVDPEKFRSKGTKSVRSRIGNIREFLKEDMSLPEFWAYLKTSLTEDGLREDRLSPEELVAVEKLKFEKYNTWEWTYGHAPLSTLVNKRYWPGGSLEIRADVKHGRITDIAFYGDFLSCAPLTELTALLKNCIYEKSAVGSLLGNIWLPTYFGSITKAEVLDTLFIAKE